MQICDFPCEGGIHGLMNGRRLFTTSEVKYAPFLSPSILIYDKAKLHKRSPYEKLKAFCIIRLRRFCAGGAQIELECWQ